MLGAPARRGLRRVADRKVHRMLVLTRKSNQSIMMGENRRTVSILRHRWQSIFQFTASSITADV